MADYTRIDDLPLSSGNAPPGGSYSTMNIHPNPYGIEPPRELPQMGLSEPKSKLDNQAMMALIQQQEQQRQQHSFDRW